MREEGVVRYITNLKELEKAVEKKKLNSYEIERIVDEWLGRYCNTSLTFSEINEMLYGSNVLSHEVDLTLLFGRQLPTRKLEHEVLLQVCEATGDYITRERGVDYIISMPSLPIDVMHSRNIEKRCYAEILMLENRKKEGDVGVRKIGIAPIRDMYALRAHELKINRDKINALRSYLGKAVSGSAKLLTEFHRNIRKEGLDGRANYTDISDVYRGIATHLLEDIEDGKNAYLQAVWVADADGKVAPYLIDAERCVARAARRNPDGEELGISELKKMDPWITATESYNYLILSALAYGPQALYVVRDGLPNDKFQSEPASKLREMVKKELDIHKAVIADFSISTQALHPSLLQAASTTPHVRKLGCDELEVALQLYIPAIELDTARNGIPDRSPNRVADRVVAEISERMFSEVRKNES